MKKIICFILTFINLSIYSQNSLTNQKESITVVGKVILYDDSCNAQYALVKSTSHNKVNCGFGGYFKIILPKKDLSQLEISFLGYRTLKIYNIPILSDSINLGIVPLFIETNDLIAMDYLRHSWLSPRKWQARKYYNDFKLHESDYKLKRDKINKEIDNYKYLFNNTFYKIDSKKDLINLK